MLERQLAGKTVVTNIADRPILVNGYNINTGLYPVLNYKPEGAQFPYIYVPIAEFARVGATVVWDESQQLLTVVTDYYQLKANFQESQRYYYLSISAFIRNLSYCERRIQELAAENSSLREQLALNP